MNSKRKPLVRSSPKPPSKRGPSPFARFERALAAERKAAQLAMNPEDMIDQRPKKRKVPPPSQSVQFNVDPMVTANAALHAVKENTNTHKVIQKWLEELALEEKEPSICPGITLAMKIAVGPNGIPLELAREVNEMARQVGMEPGDLVSLFLRIGLREERKRMGEIK